MGKKLWHFQVACGQPVIPPNCNYNLKYVYGASQYKQTIHQPANLRSHTPCEMVCEREGEGEREREREHKARASCPNCLSSAQGIRPGGVGPLGHAKQRASRAQAHCVSLWLEENSMSTRNTWWRLHGWAVLCCRPKKSLVYFWAVNINRQVWCFC